MVNKIFVYYKISSNCGWIDISFMIPSQLSLLSSPSLLFLFYRMEMGMIKIDGGQHHHKSS